LSDRAKSAVGLRRDERLPALLKGNVQNQMTSHNLPAIQRFLHAAYIVTGRFGGLGWALLGERDPARFRDLVYRRVSRCSLLACFLPVALCYAVSDFTPSRWVDSHSLR